MSPAPVQLAAIAVGHGYGDRPLFADLSLTLAARAKVGIIGDNGAGKSTLLKVMAGLQVPLSGQVVRTTGVTVDYLPQAPTFAEATVFAALATPLAPVRAAIERFEAGCAGPQADQLQHEVERLGGWSWQHRLERAASALRLEDLAQPCATLSGGQRKRLALARMLLTDADVLLLDEPTNHLDAESIDWLEHWLLGVRAAVGLVTHDRALLDAVVDTMAELRGGAAHTYPGNYSDYLLARSSQQALALRTHARAHSHLKHELAWASRAPQARGSKSRARLTRIEEAQARLADQPAPNDWQGLEMAAGQRLAGEVLSLTDVQAEVPGRGLLFAPLTLALRKKERWGILGPNGSGKTTLLEIIAGRRAPSRGALSRGKHTHVAYFAQHREQSDHSETIEGALLPQGGDTVYIRGQSMHVSAYAARFGFAPQLLSRRVMDLSGGEKSRLALAQLLLSPANVLLFDEPTNDLDLYTVGILERALSAYDGCLLVVSHDRAFLQNVITGVVALRPREGAPAAVEVVQGSYEAYSHYVALQARAAPVAPSPGAPARRDKKPPAAKARSKLSAAEKKELGDLPPAIEAAEAEIAQEELALAAPALWADGTGAGPALQAALVAKRSAIEALYARWQLLLDRDSA